MKILAIALIAGLLHAVLPHLNQFYIADQVAYGVSLSPADYLHATIYATAYMLLLLAVSVVIFQRREFL